jgi:hypothetical protein
MGYETTIVSMNMKFLNKEKGDEFMKIDDLEYFSSPVDPNNIDRLDDVHFVETNSVGRYSYFVHKWAEVLQKYMQGTIQFAGEEYDDLWKIKITPDNITIYEARMKFEKNDEQSTFINNGLDPWTGDK